MENQHRKISGYRELSEEEILLMNQIKSKGAELLELGQRLQAKLKEDHEKKRAAVYTARAKESGDDCFISEEEAELRRFEIAEPQRWASIGKTDIQTGIMALVRAVAQPAGV